MTITLARPAGGRLRRLLSLDGWVTFNLPRTVTAIGAGALSVVAGVHVFLLIATPSRPAYFIVYAAVVIASCALPAGLVASGRPFVTKAGWWLGSLVCSAFLGVYLLTRFVMVPGLPALTGRWDVTPATAAAAFAAAFVAVHTTVLTGINVAHPQRQHWHD